MNKSMHRLFLMTSALFLTGTAVGPAVADPITLIQGDYAGIQPPTGFMQSSFAFTDGTASFVPSTLTGLLAGDLTVDLTHFPPPPATMGPVNLSMLVVSDTMGHQATFNLTNAQLTNDQTAMTGTIMADAFYVSDNFGALADLSLFRTGGQGLFVANYAGIVVNGAVEPDTGSDGTATWGFFGPVSAHFVLTPGPQPVPEPASLGAWAVMALAGAAWLRRRR
jgi:MYXO-CTERM domain-containing protein